jgi:hypothetical protein
MLSRLMWPIRQRRRSINKWAAGGKKGFFVSASALKSLVPFCGESANFGAVTALSIGSFSSFSSSSY